MEPGVPGNTCRRPAVEFHLAAVSDKRPAHAHGPIISHGEGITGSGRAESTCRHRNSAVDIQGPGSGQQLSAFYEQRSSDADNTHEGRIVHRPRGQRERSGNIQRTGGPKTVHRGINIIDNDIVKIECPLVGNQVGVRRTVPVTQEYKQTGIVVRQTERIHLIAKKRDRPVVAERTGHGQIVIFQHNGRCTRVQRQLIYSHVGRQDGLGGNRRYDRMVIPSGDKA